MWRSPGSWVQKTPYFNFFADPYKFWRPPTKIFWFLQIFNFYATIFLTPYKLFLTTPYKFFLALYTPKPFKAETLIYFQMWKNDQIWSVQFAHWSDVEFDIVFSPANFSKFSASIFFGPYKFLSTQEASMVCQKIQYWIFVFGYTFVVWPILFWFEVRNEKIIPYFTGNSSYWKADRWFLLQVKFDTVHPWKIFSILSWNNFPHSKIQKPQNFSARR